MLPFFSFPILLFLIFALIKEISKLSQLVLIHFSFKNSNYLFLIIPIFLIQLIPHLEQKHVLLQTIFLPLSYFSTSLFLHECQKQMELTHFLHLLHLRHHYLMNLNWNFQRPYSKQTLQSANQKNHQSNFNSTKTKWIQYPKFYVLNFLQQQHQHTALYKITNLLVQLSIIL